MVKQCLQLTRGQKRNRTGFNHGPRPPDVRTFRTLTEVRAAKESLVFNLGIIYLISDNDLRVPDLYFFLLKTVIEAASEYAAAECL